MGAAFAVAQMTRTPRANAIGGEPYGERQKRSSKKKMILQAIIKEIRYEVGGKK